MRKKFLAVSMLAILMSIDISVWANSVNVGNVISPDGTPAITQRRKNRRARRRRVSRRTVKVYNVGSPSALPPMEKSAEPATEEMPSAGAAPNVAPAPAPLAPTQMRAPGGSPPKIKPPSVQIKPPTD